MALSAPPAGATETILHAFAGAADGTEPDAGLIADAAGNLYGTTQTGGTANFGTVFELLRPVAGSTWTNKVLYSFQGGADGYFPQAPLVLGAGGVLYSTTDQGGASGFGEVFSLTPPASGQTAWTKTTLLAFTGELDGGYPYAGAALIIGSGGELLGTTLRGGPATDGVVFALHPPAIAGNAWAEQVLYSFGGGKDGYYPEGGLLAGSGGVLYGTTSGGGTSFACSGGCGTVFQLTPPVAGGTTWIKATYSFSGSPGGAGPKGGLITDGAALYGTTYFGGGATACGSFGCGTVYRIGPTGAGAQVAETTLHAFQSGTDSEYPTAGLIRDSSGNLYGTAHGAYPNRLGAVFKLSPPMAGATQWKETILHSFTGNPDGGSPNGALLAGPGVDYGTTNYGGGAGAGICGGGCGAVYQIGP